VVPALLSLETAVEYTGFFLGLVFGLPEFELVCVPSLSLS